MTRRVVVCTLLLVALAVSGVQWADSLPETRTVASAVTLTHPPGLAVDATLKGRPDLLTGSWVEQRLAKARPCLGLAALVGLSVLLAAAVVTLRRPSPGLLSTLWRRRSVALRAPPLLRVS